MIRKPDPESARLRRVEMLRALEDAKRAQERAMVDSNPWGIPAELVLALNAEARNRRRK